MNARNELINKLNAYGYSYEDIVIYEIHLDKYCLAEFNVAKSNYVLKNALNENLFSYLDFEYDNGYKGFGKQCIRGKIVLADGNSFVRNSAGGAEWWEFKKYN